MQITIATQCDIERFVNQLPDLAQVWEGPMVVAVWVRSDPEAAAARVSTLMKQPGSVSLARYATLSILLDGAHAGRRVASCVALGLA